jgi:5-methylcytosine-specific restriction protein A
VGSRPERRKERRVEDRRSAAKRGYGYAWQKLRLQVLSNQPLCVECERQGIVTVAVDVDHIVPHRGDSELLMDRDNLQPLCKRCHGRKTARGE